MKGRTIFTALSFSIGCVAASTTSTEVPLPTLSKSSNVPDAGSGTNPIFQLAGYIKDSFVRMKDGSAQLYTNHKRCNDIRTKQRAFLANAASSLPLSEQKAAMKYRTSAGGITYEEFDFLQKGKEDRGRLANIVFMMVFAPNFVPYAFMFFPEMLPSPFSMQMAAKGPFNKWDMISNERAHSVLQTMIDVERSARVAPMMSNLNPFGKGKTKRMMERMDKLAHACGALLSADNAAGPNGADLVLKVLEEEIYTAEKPKKDRTSLTIVPKPIIKGLGRALEAPSSSQFLPAFLVRGKVLNILTQITASDEFLVDQNIDLNGLSTDLLQEACSKRLIGGPGRTNKEMIDALSSWLELSVRQPSEKLGRKPLHYNGNLARVALLSYNAIDAARDSRASSFLPRVMYQGQLYSNASTRVENKSETIDAESVKEDNKKWFMNKM